MLCIIFLHFLFVLSLDLFYRRLFCYSIHFHPFHPLNGKQWVRYTQFRMKFCIIIMISSSCCWFFFLRLFLFSFWFQYQMQCVCYGSVYISLCSESVFWCLNVLSLDQHHVSMLKKMFFFFFIFNEPRTQWRDWDREKERRKGREKKILKDKWMSLWRFVLFSQFYFFRSFSMFSFVC